LPGEITKILANYVENIKSLPLVLGWGDGNPDNFRITPDDLVVGIDFDFLSKTNIFLDLGVLITHAQLKKSQINQLINYYFNKIDQNILNCLDMGLLHYNIITMGIYLRELAETSERAHKSKIQRLLPARSRPMPVSRHMTTSGKTCLQACPSSLSG